MSIPHDFYCQEGTKNVYFVSVRNIYGTVIAGGLDISKNLSLESADIQAFVMERLPIV